MLCRPASVSASPAVVLIYRHISTQPGTARFGFGANKPTVTTVDIVGLQIHTCIGTIGLCRQTANALGTFFSVGTGESTNAAVGIFVERIDTSTRATKHVDRAGMIAIATVIDIAIEIFAKAQTIGFTLRTTHAQRTCFINTTSKSASTAVGVIAKQIDTSVGTIVQTGVATLSRRTTLV